MKTTNASELNPTSKYRLSDDQAAVIRVNPPHNLSVLEAGAYAGVSPRKIRELIAARRLKCARLGSRIVIRREFIDDLLKAQS